MTDANHSRMLSGTLLLEDFVLDLGRGQLRDGLGDLVELRPQAWAVLQQLALSPGRVVTKEEFFSAIWPGIVVTDGSLTQAVSDVRTALGAVGRQVIKTIPKRGYMLVADPGARTPGVTGVSGPRRLTNLANVLPKLYGRDIDLAAVRGVADAHRLVTIVGAVGIGKSRLAEATASSLQQCYPDGVWLVEIASLTRGDLLPGTVARALGITLCSPLPPGDELVTTLEKQRLLLVLDNCECLTDAVATLAQTLLERAPGINLLLTSQAPLGLSTERLFRLEPLAVPESPIVSEALDYGAVRLFSERVCALVRHFNLDEDNIASAVSICRQLDGLPLAIELAAARVPLLGVKGVHERLAKRFQILASGSPSRPKRHQTLRAALDWSHDLLGQEEQAVFRRLGVFRGGFTVEAAQHVVSDGKMGEGLALEVLGRLVDRSLLAGDGGERPRLRLLESMRVYAIEKMVEAGELDAWRRRHADYFAAFFEGAANALYAGLSTEGQFIRQREQDLDNLREAVENSLDTSGDVQTALNLLVATAPMCHLLPLQTQSPRWWHILSERVDPRSSARQAALCRYGRIHWSQSVWWAPKLWPDWPEVEASSLDALADARRQAHAMCVDALKASNTGDFISAYAALDRARDLESPTWPAWLRTRRIFFRASFDREAGNDASSAPINLYDALVELEFSNEGEGRWAFLIRSHLALDYLLRGKIDEAVRRLTELVRLGRAQRQDGVVMSQALAMLVLALTEQESLDLASELVPDAIQQLRCSGLWARFGLTFALLAAKRGHYPTAARMIGSIDAHMARNGTRRPRVMQRTRESALSIIVGAHHNLEVEAWLADGAILDGEVFSRLAIQCRR